MPPVPPNAPATPPLAPGDVRLQPGQPFGRYTVEALLGAGGMGEVYRAFDPTLRRKVALKVIHPDLAGQLGPAAAAARLVREARAAAALTHPNTVAIHDLGEHDGAVFLVMELVSGAPLRAFVGDTRVPVTTKVRWLVDIAKGLAAAHRKGLVHRDVKPANVMVSDDGVVKVLDFGLAKVVETASAATDAGLVVGTPRYMAPELFRGLPADTRSDEYAFGVTAYELLSGVHPGGPTGALPAAIDTLVPEATAAVGRVVMRTLSRERDARFASMEEVAAALEEALAGAAPPEASRVGASPATRREGARPAPGATALGLAATELSPSSPRRAEALVPVGPELAPPAKRGPSAFGILAVLGLLAFAGVYVATRFVGSEAQGAPGGAASAAPEAGAEAMPDGGRALAEPPIASATPVASAPSPAAADAEPAASDADAAPPSKLWGEEFDDPWLKKK